MPQDADIPTTETVDAAPTGPPPADRGVPAASRSPRRLTVAAVVLVAGAFALVLAGLDSEVFDLERHLAPKTLVLHLTALSLLVVGVPAFRRIRLDTTALLLVAFVAWGALSAALATNRWLALQGWGISLSSLIVFLAARRVGRERRWGAVAGLLGAVVLAAALGVAQAYGASWPWLAESRAPGGTFGNRNFLAHVSAIALGPAIVVSTRTRGRWLVPVLGGVAILVGAIILTRSRAAWLAAAASTSITIATLLLATRRDTGSRPWGRLTGAGIVLVAGVAAAVLVPNQLRWNSDAPYAQTLERLGEYREGSGAGRLVQYRNSLELVRLRPVLGVGPGNWFVHYPRVTEPGDPSYSGHLTIPTNPWPSSDWVAMVTERGPLGALLLLLAGAGALWAAFGGARPDPHSGPLVAGVLAAALVTGLFDAVLLLAAPSFLVWALVGLALPGPERPRVSWEPGRVPRVALRGAVILATLAVLAVGTGSTAALALTRESRGTDAVARAARVAPWEHRLQLLLAERGRCENARRAAALMPWHASATSLAEGCRR